MSAATCSRIRTTPTTNSNLNVVTETTVDIKLGNISNMACSLTSDNSLRSSESSDPLESDYSEEADEEEPEEAEAIKHDHNTDDRENDYDYDESAAENEEDNQNDDDANDDTDRGEDVNETGNEGDDNTEDNSDTDTARSLRIYSLDDFQIIKTVGTGTFGRVCLCRDRVTNQYCAMKILAMSDVIRLKQVEHVKNEKSILSEIDHPFLLNLEWSTKDNCCLYIIFEYVCGGELFTYLRNAGRFNTETSMFFAAEIVLAFEYLHSLQIVYRDLKPENVLIGRDGHVKITDFGFAKKLKDRTWTLCGTPEYLAPEIIQSKGHNKAVDWWALGILIYEMLVGYPPFYDENPFGIYEKILGGKIDWPRHIDPIAKDLIKKLLTHDRTKRLGNMKNGANDVKRHRWFKNLVWLDVYHKHLKAPIVPEVQSEGDTTHFDDYPEKDWKPARSLDQSELQLFIDF